MVSLEDALALKEAGNGLFREKNFAAAAAEYSSALDGLVAAEASAEAAALHATLLINRAACYLKAERSEDAESDCTAALALHGEAAPALEGPQFRVKALYRRAAAREALGRNADAFKDVREALSLDPQSKAGAALARRLKEKLSRATADRGSPAALACATLGEALADPAADPEGLARTLKGLYGLALDSEREVIARMGQMPPGPLAATDPTLLLAVLGLVPRGPPAARAPALRLCALLAADAAVAQQLLHSGFDRVEGAVAFVSGAAADGDAAERKALVVGLSLLLDRLLAVGSAKAEGAAARGFAFLADKYLGGVPPPAPTPKGEDPSPLAPTPLAGGLDALCLRLYGAALDAQLSLLPAPALDGAPFAFPPEDLSTLHCAVDAAVKLCAAPDAPRRLGAADRFDADERRATFAEHRRRSAVARGLCAAGLALVPSLQRLLRLGDPFLRAKGGLAVAQILRGLDEREARHAVSRSALAGFRLPAGRALSAEELPRAVECGGTLSALLSAGDAAVASWAAEEHGAVAVAAALLGGGHPAGVPVGAQLLDALATHKEARSLLAPVVEAGLLEGLLESPSGEARSAAAAALAKLGTASDALAADAAAEGKLLRCAMELLRAADEAEPPAPEGEAPPAGAQAEAGGGAERAATKALEVLSFLARRTRVKDELCLGSSRCARALERLARLEVRAAGAACLPFAQLMCALSVTREQLVREALAEKDMSVEQYEQLEKLQRSAAGGDPTSSAPGRKEDADSPEALRSRVLQLSGSGCLAALVRLLRGGEGLSATAAAAVTRALCNVLSVPETRGEALRIGALGALCALGGEAEEWKGPRAMAAHAVAKVLVTTNPSTLSETSRLECIGPLLWLCRHVEATNLMQFEALLALTNLLSTGGGEAAHLCRRKGLQSLQYLQASDHRLVRRAATEALANCVPCAPFRRLFEDAALVRLWVGLAEDWDDGEYGEVPPSAAADVDIGPDYETARAAMGCLAMLCAGDADVAAALLREGAAELVLEGLDSGRAELMHRAVAIAGGCCGVAEEPQRAAELREKVRPRVDMLLRVSKVDPAALEDAGQRKVVENMQAAHMAPVRAALERLQEAFEAA